MTEGALEYTTLDAFLGGQIHVLQPRKGFRSGVDAVLLAASIPAQPGHHVLELGCGVGVASLCLHARVPELTLNGVEIQAQYAELAKRNAASNEADLTITTADLRALPASIRQMQFNHVMMNPPYFDRASGPAAQDAGRNIALAGETALSDWIETGIRRLAPKGSLTVIQHITRLPEVMSTVQAKLGGLVLQPICGRPDTLPNLFILQGRHSARAPFVLRRPLIMHDAFDRTEGRESYSEQVQQILRNGAPLRIAD